MEHITLPVELAERFRKLTQPTTIVDETGRIQGTFIPTSPPETSNDAPPSKQDDAS